MGQFAVRTAVNFDFIDEIVVADRDEHRAREFAEKCGPKASFAGVDVLRVEKGSDPFSTLFRPSK
jgi:saccharopine dehydrogenase-like NADP-dependent oxidoreductase